eukprot:127426_1
MIIRPQHSSLFIIKVRHFPSFVSRDSSWSKQTVAKHKPDKTQITTVTSHNHITILFCLYENRSNKTKRNTQSQSFFLYVYGLFCVGFGLSIFGLMCIYAILSIQNPLILVTDWFQCICFCFGHISCDSTLMIYCLLSIV